MNITQIRNATLLITYAGKRLLIDPMLAPKGAYPGFPGTAHAQRRNPTVELPVDVNTLLDADAVIVTHTHDDHWDRTAAERIAKDKPIYVQNDRDAALLRSQGFINLTIMTDETTFGGGSDCENVRRPARDRPRLRRARTGGAAGRGLWRGAASS